MVRNLILILVSMLLLSSCQREAQARTGIFLGGQIINPSSRAVTLYQGNLTIETLELDGEMRFQKKFDSLGSGIYKLEHLPEYQTVLLEEGDSLWVRINAAAFDESIVYSGPGASKNNFLMELFLNQEKENRFLSNKFSRSSRTFNRLLDSLLNEKKQSWILMDSLNKLSPIAQKVTQAAYIYNYANIRERYALLRGSLWDQKEDSLFFGYRKFLNYGDNDLAFFDPYVNYILNYVSKQALQPGESYFKEKQSTDFNIRRLEVLDQQISGTLLRNNLARAIAFEEILTFENHRQHDLFLQYYATVSTSPSYLAEVLNLHSDINRMEPRRPLPEIKLQNTDRKTISSKTLVKDKTTVIYFWSQTQMNHYRNTIDRVRELENNFPKLRFVGICIQPFNAMVEQVQKMMEISLDNQYALVNFEKASKAWVLTLLNKAIVVDSNGTIIEGFGNFSDSTFKTLLEEL